MTQRKAASGSEESWDDFWAEVNRDTGPTEVIRGVRVPVPRDMPLNLAQRARELEDSDREEDLHELVATLFGAGVFQRWLDAGMTVMEFQVVLAWGMSHASGKPVTFREAHEAVASVEQGKDDPPVPANRAARRSQSAATGGRSKPTSSASTGSARRTSRA